MTNSMSFKDINTLSRGVYEEYYYDLLSDVIERLGETYDPDTHDEIQERLVITLLPRSLPTAPGSVVLAEGQRFILLTTGWINTNGGSASMQYIEQHDWKQIL